MGGRGGTTRRRPSRGREWSMWRFLHASQMRLLISMSTPLMRSRVKTDVGGRGALLVPHRLLHRPQPKTGHRVTGIGIRDGGNKKEQTAVGV